MSFNDELRGVLFRNKDKTPGDKRPDYKGNLTIGGTKYQLAAWLRASKQTGEKFMSLQLEIPQPKADQGGAPVDAQPVAAPPVAPPPEDPDDIPF